MEHIELSPFLECLLWYYTSKHTNKPNNWWQTMWVWFSVTFQSIFVLCQIIQIILFSGSTVLQGVTFILVAKVSVLALHPSSRLLEGERKRFTIFKEMIKKLPALICSLLLASKIGIWHTCLQERLGQGLSRQADIYK